MDHLRHQAYENKLLNNTQVLTIKNSTLESENDFKPINISINDTDKLEKKNLQRTEHLQKTLSRSGTIG